MLSIQEFLKKINTGSAVRENIPMGLGMGFPVLHITGDRLLVSVFYYRSVLRPNDQTLLMPPEYKLTLDYPSGKLISFENLRLDPRYAKVNFDKPAGTFRHEAIKHLDRDGYKKAKEPAASAAMSVSPAVESPSTLTLYIDMKVSTALTAMK